MEKMEVSLKEGEKRWKIREEGLKIWVQIQEQSFPHFTTQKALHPWLSVSLWFLPPLCFSHGGSPCNPCAERWVGYRHTHHQKLGFLGDVEALLPALPSHHRPRRWSLEDHQGSRRLWLRALQPQWYQPNSGSQGLLHFLQGLCLPLLRLHGF